MDLFLVVRKGAQVGRVFTVSEGDRKTIGRAKDCDIRLPDQGVSRRHCTIENVGAVFRVVDLESAKGSFINGQLVERGSLGPGDQLAVGPTVLECRARPTSPDRAPGEATLAYREEGTTTVVRKVVDTQYPGMEALATAGKPEDLDVLQRAQRNLATAYEISKMLANAPGLEKLLDGVIESIFAAINADRAALILRESSDRPDELKVVAARSRSGDDEDPEEITLSRAVVRDVLENGVSSLSSEAAADATADTRVRGVMCAPVRTDDSVIGVLYADSRSLTGAFAETDLELLALIGNQAGVAIYRAQLLAQIEKFFFDTIRAIVVTIDAKDSYTHRHSERVACIAAEIAEQLSMTEEEIEVVKLSALLHDVGKVCVPDAILNKPGRLTKEESDEIKKHPVHGVDYLKHIESPRFKEILPGVRHHHEHWDGSGYPDGLAGEKIPLAARIIHVAEAVDAMLSEQPYRPALSVEQVASELRRLSGKQFDPDLVEKFLESGLLKRAAQLADSANST